MYSFCGLTEKKGVGRQTYTVGVQIWIINGFYRGGALSSTKYHVSLEQPSGPGLQAFCLSYL